MSKIDLSQAKVGDKFRDRYGRLHELIYILKGDCSFRYLLVDEQKDSVYNYKVDGSYLQHDISNLDLVEQVFDKPLDELIEEGTKQIKENDDEIAEENELQRRQEVVELAEKLVTNELFAVTNHMHDMRELGAVINLDSSTEYAFLIAEEFVNNKSKYLKNGKLC